MLNMRNAQFVPTPFGTTFSKDQIVAPKLLAPRTNMAAAYKPHGGAKNSSSLAISNPLYSLSEQHPALSDYWKYRIYIMNHDTVGKTLGLAKAVGSPTDMHSGASLPWLVQKKNGVDVLNLAIPAASFVSAEDQDVDDIAPALLPLDPVEASPVSRTDGGTAVDSGKYPLLLSRTLWVDGVRPLGALDADWRDRTGLLFKAGGSSYDFVTLNSSFAPTNSYAYQTTFVEYSYTKPTLSILTSGDSTNTGVTTTSGKYAPIDEAARLARNANSRKLLVPLKFASSGRRSAGMLGIFSSVIAAGLRPTVALIPYWTVNDGSEAANFEQSRLMALRLIELCDQHEIIPILLTPPPYNSIGTGSRLEAWRAYRASALSFSSHMLVCDMAGKVCDTNTAQFLPGMTNDGTHYNDASTPIIGEELYKTIQVLL